MSEVVNVDTTSGTPFLILNDGGKAVYASGAGTNTLVFSYTVATGDNTTTPLKVTGLDPSGGAITDLAGNSAVLTKATGTFSAIHIDTTPPTFATIAGSPTSGNVITGATVKITVTASEVVTVSGVPQLILDDGGVANYVSGSGTNKLGL